MSRLLKAMAFLALGVILFSVAQTAQASVLSSLFPGVVNQLEDEDYESLVNRGPVGLDADGKPVPTPEPGLHVSGGADPVLNVGDRVLGVFSIQKIRNDVTLAENNVSGPGVDTFTALFFIEVASKPVNAFGGVDLYFKPLQSGGANAAIAQWAAEAVSLGLTLPTLTDNDTMVVVFDHPNEEGVTPAGTVSSSLDSYANYPGSSILWELGFALGDGTEFWRTINGGLGADNIDSAKSGTVNPAPANQLSLNVTAAIGASSEMLDPHNRVFAAIFSQLQGVGTFEPGSSGNWNIKTDTDLFIKPIPEPGSFAIAVVLTGLFGGAAMRSRLRGRRQARK